MKAALLTAAFLPLAACAAQEEHGIGLANPASVYCESVGGRVEIRREAAGDAGYCHLPDGRVIEEWTFFRAQNKG
ncbi:MAG: DUF333 domain-containing protein [Pseudochelatococcus sp.]|uniref:putative hemolysin n=1 Tax=Pseudochelatococcus sp. TaxID=2020869 RepID=UPI003D942878